MAGQFAGELQVTPWDALLVALRRAASKAAWYQGELLRVSEAGEPADLLPGGAHHSLVREAERADQVMAKLAKMTLDAGVAERLVQHITGQAQRFAGAVTNVLDSDELGLTPAQLDVARRLLRLEILRLEADESRPREIEGGTTDGTVTS